ncbi:hypothetical protein Tco_0980219, partial [Tanacetum coccineum]
LDANAIVEALSHGIKTGRGMLICRSLRRHISQLISQVLSAKAIYSASVEDLKTTPCLLDCQEIKLVPRKMP